MYALGIIQLYDPVIHGAVSYEEAEALKDHWLIIQSIPISFPIDWNFCNNDNQEELDNYKEELLYKLYGRKSKRSLGISDIKRLEVFGKIELVKLYEASSGQILGLRKTSGISIFQRKFRNYLKQKL